MAVARLASIVFDCADPASLARFWAELLGGEIAVDGGAFVAVRTDSGWLAAFQVPNYQPPTWPDGDVPKQMHVDLSVDDLEVAQAEAVRLGARVAERQPDSAYYRVLLDPAGHPFCLSIQIPE